MKLALSVVLLSFAVAAPAFAESAFDRAIITAREMLYNAECHRCQADNSQDPTYGPSLGGIAGREAGSAEGYEFSDVLANAGTVWTPAALRAWMEDNAGLMPGTKIRHVGIEDRTVQDFILPYLESL